MKRGRKRRLALTAVMSLLLAGCVSSREIAGTASLSPEQPTASLTGNSVPPPARLPVSGISIRSAMTLSNNVLPGTARKNMYLRFQMIQGTYSEDWNPGPYMGTLYEGRFQIVIADDNGLTLSTSKLDDIFPEPLTFTHHFAVALDDYNGDGFPDFTLGQRAGSNGGEYKILTVSEDLRVRELPVRGADSLYISKGAEGGSSYSVKLGRTKTGLLSYALYSQKQGKYVDRFLKWQNGEFVLVSS